jgi:hypothetical protein
MSIYNLKRLTLLENRLRRKLRRKPKIVMFFVNTDEENEKGQIL